MFALAYASRATRPFDEPTIRELASHAAGKNLRMAVTGYLNYKSGVFFQYLEGGRQTVMELMGLISQDERHEVANVVTLGELGERLFSGWQMRYVTPAEVSLVQMEDVLEGVLLTMTEKLYGEEVTRATVLRQVYKLASMRGRVLDPA